MENKIFLVSGQTFTGKSHLALTSPTPTVVLDTEQTIGFLIKKHPDQDKIHPIKIAAWSEMEEILKKINAKPPTTIILDSGSPITSWAYQDAARERGRDTEIWFHATKKIENLINLIRVIPCKYFIITSRVREKFENDQPTGKLAIDINPKIIYAADVHINCTGKTDEGFVYYLTKDRTRGIHSQRLVNTGFDGFIKQDK
jgi:hypothetical protein